MEGILMFVSVVMIVFGVLQIILFFKMWGMTNNVSRITRILESKITHPQEPTTNKTDSRNEQTAYSEIELPNDIAIGSSVIRLLDGKRMIVDSIENGKYFCKGSMMEGYKYYEREEIKPMY